ncbi:RNA-binding domain-containing protein [Enterococcus mundtii]|uniref:RNA-binding domain-containing protein n=1 Tax=Enterococcus mundtii TaxID=53346 RepID=UPI00192A02AF|nr:RNA-binding domain-containing protein [Enterococcus mundtii]
MKDEIFTEPKENFQLEFKKSQTKLSNDVWSTYSAFANTNGGIIILGIEELVSKKEYQVVGVDNPEKVITEFWNCIHDKQKVSVNLLTNEDVQTFKVSGKSIIEINVPKAPYERRPVYINNNKSKTYIRTDDGDRIADDAQFKYLIVDSQNDIDSELLQNYDIDDLNLETVNEYRNLLYKNTNNSKYFELSHEELLKNIGVLKKDRQDSKSPYRLTIGGLLFLGKYNSITDRFKKFQLDYFKKQSFLDTDWRDRVSSGDMNYPEMNLFSFYNLVIQKLELSVPDSYRQEENMTRGSYRTDLLLALKEALVNTLMHAYYVSDKVIKIINCDDYVSFYNPGEMKVSKDEFINGSFSVTRNSIISTLFRRVGIAEKGGSGGPRIFEVATKNSLRTPEVDTNFDSTEVRIWKINMLESLSGLNEVETSIIKYAMEKPAFKIKDIVNSTSYKDHTVRKNVNNLVEKEMLQKIGNGKATMFVLSSSEETGVMTFKRLLKEIEVGFMKSR